MAEKKKKAKNSLTPKRKRFGNEFVIDLNGTQAAIRAGYSPKTANEQAARLLANASVQEYIKGLMKGLEEKTGITQEKVLKEIAAVAFADVTDYAQIIEKPLEIFAEGQAFTVENEDGSLKMHRCVEPVLTENLTETQRKALASIKEGKHGIEIKTHDKLKALQMLGDYLSLFTDKERLSIERRRLELEEERLELEKQKQNMGGVDDGQHGVIMLAPLLVDEDEEADSDE